MLFKKHFNASYRLFKSRNKESYECEKMVEGQVFVRSLIQLGHCLTPALVNVHNH